MRWLISILLLWTWTATAQLWLGTLDSARAIDWTNVGCGTFSYTFYTGYTASATAAQINTGLGNCPVGSYVVLSNGTYNLNDGLTVRSGIGLEGLGANGAKLFFTGTTACNFGGLGGTCICLGNGDNVYGPVLPNAETTETTWAAGYTQGTNVIKLNSVSGLAVGMLLFLDQLDDTVDGYPSAGDLVVGSSTASNISRQGGSAFHRSGRNMAQVTRVQSISGTNVTIDPPIYYPGYRSSKSPGAYYSSSSTQPKTNAYVKNLSIDASGAGACHGILLFNAYNCLISGVRLVNTNTTANLHYYHTRAVQSLNCTIKDSYAYGPTHNTADQYAYVESFGCRNLYQNLICEKNGGQYEFNGNSVGSVWAYNFGTNSWVNIIVEHDAGNAYNLFEGNVGSGASADVIHGTGNLSTYHRNRFYGGATAGTGDCNFWISTYRRFFNFTGNILGKNNTVYKELEAQSGNDIFSFGQNNAAESGAGNPPTDPFVSSTAMLWGNWNNVSNTVLWLNAEVPSTLSFLSNSIPAAQTVPNSYYLTAKPTNWWGTTWDNDIPWPPHGPEVTGGDLPNCSGHANKIPSFIAWENLPNDSYYGSLNVREFNATNYVQSAASQGGATYKISTTTQGKATISGKVTVQ